MSCTSYTEGFNRHRLNFDSNYIVAADKNLHLDLVDYYTDH